MIDAAIFYCNKDLKLHCEREQKLQGVAHSIRYYKSHNSYQLSVKNWLVVVDILQRLQEKDACRSFKMVSWILFYSYADLIE